jgi:hypothetical protein
MSSATADDIIGRLTQLATKRSDFVPVWKQVAEVAAPDAPEFLGGYGGLVNQTMTTLGIQRANSARRSVNLFDSTAVWAVDRLASGLEGLIMPQSDTWHTLQLADIVRSNPNDEEVEWLEAVRDLMFRVRYDAQSGWQAAIQMCLRRLSAFGTSFMFVEEGFGSAPIRYRQIPLNESFATVDQWDILDGFYRPYTLTARQAVQKFGDKVSEQIRQAANDPKRAETDYGFIHAIAPRGDFGSPSQGVRKAPWASIHVEHESRRIVGESGFFEFPIIDFRWLPDTGRVYGESPVMRTLADIQSLQLIARNELRASQQALDPPLLIARNGVVNRPDTNAGGMIAGGLDAQGRRMVDPLLTGQRIDFAQAVIQSKRTDLKESLYINLFATLVDNPRMSATESLIRAQEKGELLGPAGSRIQESLARLVERESGILSRKGAYDPESVYAVPRSLQGKRVGPKRRSGPSRF